MLWPVAVITPSEQAELEGAYDSGAHGRRAVLEILDGLGVYGAAADGPEGGADGPGGAASDAGGPPLSANEMASIRDTLRRMAEVAAGFPETMTEALFMMHTRTLGLTT